MLFTAPFLQTPKLTSSLQHLAERTQSKEERKLRQYEYNWEVHNADMQPAQLITQEFDCSSLPLFFKHPSSQAAFNILQKGLQSKEERKLRQYEYNWEVHNADMQPAQLITQEFDCSSPPLFFKHPSSQAAFNILQKGLQSKEERKLRHYEYNWEVHNADMQPAQLITQEFDCSSLPLFFKHPSSQAASNILQKGLLKGRKEAQTIRIQLGGPQC